MPEVEIRAGTRFSIPGEAEHRKWLGAELQAWERERQRGKKRMELMLPGPLPLASTFFINNIIDEGYIWSLRLASANLASSGTLVIYKATSTGDTRRPLFSGASASTQVATWSSDQARMRHSDGLYFSASQNITEVFISAWQVPAEREGEIYD